MKFKGKISKIDSEGVKAREDNLKPRPDTLSYIPLSGIGNYKRAQVMADWQEEEANRKEYKVKGKRIA